MISRLATHTAFLFILLMLSSACVELSPAGSHIKILTEEQRAQVASCTSLGTVSISSKDALRNNAAALSGDTAIIRQRLVGQTSVIQGDVFRCATPTNNKAPLNQQAAGVRDADDSRKSALCQEKGGNWISGQCILTIE